MTKKRSICYTQLPLYDIAVHQASENVLASKIILGMGHFNRYRVIIFRSAVPTPFPSRLNFQISRERKNHPGRRPKRVWRPVGAQHVAGITGKVFRRITQMMAECLVQAHADVVDLDGVPVPWEYESVCQQIRACEGVIGWRKKLNEAISVLHETWSVLEYGGNQTRLSVLQIALQTAGFSPQEIDGLMPAYIPGYGLLLKDNAYARYLEIAQPFRHHTLITIQNTLASYSPTWTEPEAAVISIVSAVPENLIHHIVRNDGSLRWQILDLNNPSEQDVEWELIHHRSIPTEVLAQYPALLAKYGL